MCIRDSLKQLPAIGHLAALELIDTAGNVAATIENKPGKACLLYTSDAADEQSSVDLGGRRIIKKKNNIENRCNSAQRI